MGYFSEIAAELASPHKELSQILPKMKKRDFQNPAFVRESLFSLIDERKHNCRDYSDLLQYIFRIDILEQKRSVRLSE